ncbi:hypothetical protein ELUMI_v1c08470 [Williamsoniiplasma luminosum]|uniref:Uncharacterized protein n=1 Tax=Williamsoniiplasma luminosum TaxID=214888 RepID=A0A2K8NWJ3_9MOLU|nr:hypothetical protein [Williamsoniiplasma luminosum]ATZ17568.1 hypothetical protein ELUMI_v1c08470 [Williamsoniiplasma luminosum]
MTKRKFDEFDTFLIDNFANNENEWNKITSYFVANFLENYYQNLNYMKTQLNVVKNRKKPEISQTEENKLIRILAILELKKCIHIYSEDRQYFVDIVLIRKKFKKVSKEKSNLILETIAEMEKESSTKFNTSFGELEKSFKALISFIKEVEFRKEAYIKLLLDKDKKITIAPLSEYTHNFY